MEVIKICRFCGEQIRGEAVKCRWCGEMVGNRVRVARGDGSRIKISPPAATVAGPGPRPPRVKIEPVKFISGDRIGVIQTLCVISCAWIIYMTTAIGSDPGEIEGWALLGGITAYILVWILFIVLLRRFTGTGRIIKPLVSMLILCGAAVTLLVMAAGGGEHLPGGIAVVGGLSTIGCALAGFICYLVAAARMASSRSAYLPLRGVGYTSTDEVGMAWARGLDVLGGIINASPLAALFAALWICRRRLPDEIKRDNIIETE
ncbi:MAG: hypothetical protein LUE10_03775 [Alistipes sp.]|nr:hypothetical protein [Alistipes sp.]